MTKKNLEHFRTELEIFLRADMEQFWKKNPYKTNSWRTLIKIFFKEISKQNLKGIPGRTSEGNFAEIEGDFSNKSLEKMFFWRNP